MDSPKSAGGAKRVDPQVESDLEFYELNLGGRAVYGGIAQLVERLVRNEFWPDIPTLSDGISMRFS